jgi:uncharacterized protein (TIGR04551 family)
VSLALLVVATGFTDIVERLPRAPSAFEAHGELRMRTELLYNLDLDRTAGPPLFPIPASDPTAQTLLHADLRLRADLAAFAAGGMVAIRARLDVLDGAVGTDAVGAPQASTTLEPDALLVRRAWGEALTPVGLLAAGRMGTHWGLGILTNSGDCADCDGGDVADRISFVTPVAGLLWAAAFDFSSTGPVRARPAGLRELDLDPADDVRTITFAALRWRSGEALARRGAAGKATIDWGLFASHRWQDEDVPATYLPVATVAPLGAGSWMHRGYRATAFDAWLRLVLPRARIELETAVVVGSVDQPSLVPGVLLREPLESTQIGAALESELGSGPIAAGLDLGFASGDPAPGFGAFPAPGDPPPSPGALDGPRRSRPGICASTTSDSRRTTTSFGSSFASAWAR